MDLEFSDDQQQLRRSVRAFLDRECPTSLVRHIVEHTSPAPSAQHLRPGAGRISDAAPNPEATPEHDPDPAASLWRKMVELDWPALAVAHEHGGLGLGFVEVAVVAEELGASLAPGPYLPTVTQFAAALDAAGTPEQRRRFLPGLAAGELVGTLAVADHPNRWAPEDVTATAERTGDGYVLSGIKQMVMAAPEADQVVVAAIVGGLREDPRLFVVPGDQLAIEPVRALDASRPLSTVVVDHVEVPADCLLDGPGHPGALARVLDVASVALALEVVGSCRTLLDATVAYAKDRHQFGVPIGSFQAVKHKLADCFVALQRARALAYYAVAAIAEGSPERAMAASMAKAAADECQRTICRDCLQTLGGIGFTWEHDAQLFVKRARSSAMLFGAAAEHRLRVAALLGVASPSGSS